MPIDKTWALKPGETIVRKKLHQSFGGRKQGGIGPSAQTKNVLLFTDAKVGERHGYIDGWKDDGCFHYTGEGQRGDQQLASGNAAIYRHQKEGRALRLFRGVGGPVEYMGEFRLAEQDPYYMTDAPETGGGPLRSVIVFRLRPIDITAPMVRAQSGVASDNQVTVVPIEDNQSERFVVDPDRKPYEAEKREARLIKEFCAYITKQGKIAERLRILPKGEAKPIFCDLYIATDGMLIEAKGTVNRNAIRMALGQLVDYGRFVDTKIRALLLPSKPRSDILALLSSAKVGIFYSAKDGGFSFIGS